MTKQERRKQAREWAEATGKGQGTPEYMQAFMYGYFNHSGTSAKHINTVVLEQFEELLDQLESGISTTVSGIRSQ